MLKLYKIIYQKIGGRAWTDIVRDEQKEEPLLIMLIFMGLGILLVLKARQYWWQILLGFLFGILIGHFWW